jgi:hypothetical protein
MACCDPSAWNSGMGLFATFYFLSFIMVGSLILLSLFIGMFELCDNVISRTVVCLLYR